MKRRSLRGDSHRSAALSHCESAGCGTSTCLNEAGALTVGGPSIRFTICSLNASV